VPQVKAGKVRVLMVTGERRSSYMPEVPSAKDAGLELPLRTWYAVFAPAATPRDVVQRLNAESNRIFADAGYAEKYLTALGLTASGMSVDDFSAFLKRDREAFAQLAKTLGLKPEP